MSASEPIKDTETYRDSIATVDDKGKRVWIYPKKPKGRYYNARTYVSWALLLFLFGMPFVKYNGEPLLLFNVLERKFILFGILFTPQDFHLFALAMITFVVFIILFTVIFGRLFCGWVCPQTIFMEMVFRKIEYWIEGDANAQRRLNKAPWTSEKIMKKGLKFSIFFALAVLVANTFLSYIIGVEEVMKIAIEPISQNAGGFITMLLFSGAFFFVFTYMREQVCIAVCPYGRLQGVLLDKNSVVVSYDFVRGEPRGKIRKKKKVENPVESIQNQLGDCIDCKLCVHVCPTGIDIRNGTQLECVNCTACMDACDEVMDKIGRDRELIRYDSYNGVAESRKRIFTPRAIAYSVLLFVLVAINVALLTSRSDVEAVILRTPGMLYQKVDETYISNLYNYQIINKTNEAFPIEFKLISEDGRIRPVGEIPNTIPEKMVEGAFFIDINKELLDGPKNRIIIEVYSDGKLLDKVKTNFMGPIK